MPPRRSSVCSKAALKTPTDDRVAKLYTALKDGSAIDCVDPLLEQIVNDGNVNADRLHDVAIWLATKAADREPVKKTALAFLGVLQGYDDRQWILPSPATRSSPSTSSGWRS